mmetsp:Transcript_12162/g.22546  ORF Transcript_12162/g.22546 Transcript_12162/m.22546 type:complete len:580 (+) Transcript_12162:162-1901(+)
MELDHMPAGGSTTSGGPDSQPPLQGLTDAGVDRLKKMLRKATKADKTNVVSGLDLDQEAAQNILVLVKNGGPHASQVAWELLFCVLASGNAKTRLLALKLVDKLYLRSRAFRRGVHSQYRELLQQVVEIPGLSVLPPPDLGKALLHRVALKLIKKWKERFSGESPVHRLTARFLDAKLGRVGRTLTHNPNAEQERRRHERRRRMLVLQFETVRGEMSQAENNVDAIEASLAQLGMSLEILHESLANAAHLKDERAVSDAKNDPGSALTPEPLQDKNKDNVNDGSAEQSSDESDDDLFDVEWGTVGQVETTGQADADFAEWEALEAEQERREKAMRETADLVAGVPLTVQVNLHQDALSQSGEETASQEPSRVSELGPESVPVLEALQDAVTETVHSHLPTLRRWIRVLSEVELDATSARLECGALLSKALRLRTKLEKNVEQARPFGVRTAHAEGRDQDFLPMLDRPSSEDAQSPQVKGVGSNSTQDGHVVPQRNAKQRLVQHQQPENIGDPFVPSLSTRNKPRPKKASTSVSSSSSSSSSSSLVSKAKKSTRKVSKRKLAQSLENIGDPFAPNPKKPK